MSLVTRRKASARWSLWATSAADVAARMMFPTAVVATRMSSRSESVIGSGERRTSRSTPHGSESPGIALATSRPGWLVKKDAPRDRPRRRRVDRRRRAEHAVGPRQPTSPRSGGPAAAIGVNRPSSARQAETSRHRGPRDRANGGDQGRLGAGGHRGSRSRSGLTLADEREHGLVPSSGTIDPLRRSAPVSMSRAAGTGPWRRSPRGTLSRHR